MPLLPSLPLWKLNAGLGTLHESMEQEGEDEDEDEEQQGEQQQAADAGLTTDAYELQGDLMEHALREDEHGRKPSRPWSAVSTLEAPRGAE